MKRDKTMDPFNPHAGHIVPRIQTPPPLKPAHATHELAAGFMLGKDPNTTIVACFTCRKAIFTVNVLQDAKHSLTTEVKPLGNWKVPKQDDNDCPLCGGQYRRFDPKFQKFQYLTSNGVL